MQPGCLVFIHVEHRVIEVIQVLRCPLWYTYQFARLKYNKVHISRLHNIYIPCIRRNIIRYVASLQAIGYNGHVRPEPYFLRR